MFSADDGLHIFCPSAGNPAVDECVVREEKGALDLDLLLHPQLLELIAFVRVPNISAISFFLMRYEQVDR